MYKKSAGSSREHLAQLFCLLLSISKVETFRLGFQFDRFMTISLPFSAPLRMDGGWKVLSFLELNNDLDGRLGDESETKPESLYIHSHRRIQTTDQKMRLDQKPQRRRG